MRLAIIGLAAAAAAAALPQGCGKSVDFVDFSQEILDSAFDRDVASIQIFQDAPIDKHNELRKRHGVPALKWSQTLENYATAHSKKCVFQHSGGPYGENLALGYPTKSAAVQGWYDEIKNYDFNKPGFSGNTGHFTQVVWKGTTHVGCGAARCSKGLLVTCSYNPPGNFQGKYRDNVFKPR